MYTQDTAANSIYIFYININIIAIWSKRWESQRHLFNWIYFIIKINFVVHFFRRRLFELKTNVADCDEFVSLGAHQKKKERDMWGKKRETKSMQWEIYVGKLWKKLSKKFEVSSGCRVMNTQEKATKMGIVYLYLQADCNKR